MRILQVINGLCAGGAETFVTDLAVALQDAHSVTVMTYAGALDQKGRALLRRLESAGVDAISLERRSALQKVSIPRLLAEATRRTRPDVVHVHLDQSELFVTLAKSLGATDAVYIRTLHTIRVNRRSARLLQPVIRRSFDWHVACSREVLGSSELRLPMARSSVIENGLARQKTVSAESRRAARCELGLDPGKRVLLCIGSMTPRDGILPKAQDLLLEAFAVSSLKDRAVLVLAGDGSHKQRFQQQAAALGLADCVRFEGVVADVAPYIHAADLGVLPSRFEGLPLAGIEFAVRGVPLVVSDIPALRVFDQEGTIRCRVSDAEDLARALRDAVEQEDELDRRARKSAASYGRRFDIDNTASEYNELYHRLSAERAGK